MEDFFLAPGLLAEIVAHAQEGAPEEVCGLIAGAGSLGSELYRGLNVARYPRITYEMDLATLARQLEFGERGLGLAAIYHSHPHGPDIPSSTDIDQAYYPESVYIICSLANPAAPSVRGFRILDGQLHEVRLVESLSHKRLDNAPARE